MDVLRDLKMRNNKKLKNKIVKLFSFILMRYIVAFDTICPLIARDAI